MNNFYRALVSDWLGTMFLLAAVIGSGIMAENLAAGNMAIALLGNTIPTGAILVVLITILGPISGAHLNPAVTIAFLLRGEDSKAGSCLCRGSGCGCCLWEPFLRISCLSFHSSRKSCGPAWRNGDRSLWQPLVCWRQFLAHCGGRQRLCQ